MLQAIAVATAFFICFVFEVLTKGFIRVVLDELALVGNPLRLRDPSPRGMRRQAWQDSQQLGAKPNQFRRMKPSFPSVAVARERLARATVR